MDTSVFLSTAALIFSVIGAIAAAAWKLSQSMSNGFSALHERINTENERMNLRHEKFTQSLHEIDTRLTRLDGRVDVVEATIDQHRAYDHKGNQP